MDKPIMCPYCDTQAELVDSKEIYGESYGYAYLCRKCRAYVGCHRGSKKPLGRLANGELRLWKQRAHLLFDPIWKTRLMTRSQAYIWLGEELGLLPDVCHIGMFDVEQCKEAVRVCAKLWGEEGK